MPSNQKRYICVYCGSKRVVNKMKASFYRGYKAFGWHCDLSKIPKGSSASHYCSNRTPQDNFLTLIQS